MLDRKSLERFLGLINSQNSTILDVGCGPGNITRFLLDQRPDLRVTGIDTAANMIVLARENNPGAVFKIMNGQQLQLPAKSFNAIVAGFYLPYVSGRECSEFFLQCQDLLKNEGILYVSTMAGASEKSGKISSSSEATDQFYIFYHTQSFLTRLLKDNHFEILYSYELQNDNNIKGVHDLIIISKLTDPGA